MATLVDDWWVHLRHRRAVQRFLGHVRGPRWGRDLCFRADKSVSAQRDTGGAPDNIPKCPGAKRLRAYFGGIHEEHTTRAGKREHQGAPNSNIRPSIGPR